MLVAILSDVHDNTTNLLAALAEAEEQGCRHLLFTGDMTMLSTFRTLREEWQYGMDLVFGNNEFNRGDFFRLAELMPDTRLHGDEADITLADRRIYLSHYPHLAAQALNSGQYDAVFYGHTHTAHQQLVGRTLLANPGEICGVRSKPSYAVYNTDDNSLHHYTL